MIPFWRLRWWTSPSYRIIWLWKKHGIPGLAEGITRAMQTQGDAQMFDSKAFEAKYAGYCNAQCEERIEPGQRVMYVGYVLVHEACAASAPAGERDKSTKFQGTSLEDMGF